MQGAGGGRGEVRGGGGRGVWAEGMEMKVVKTPAIHNNNNNLILI